ncbi:MAG: GntR family transcriptional regulator [Pseudomonadota bacterium]
MTEPLYRMVYRKVIERIADGTYPPGAMLPNEFELAADLGVSQGTARKALSSLEDRAIVQRRQGKGTFVILRTPENSLFHFFRLRTKTGEQVTPEPHTETITKRKATAAERATLFENPSHVFEITRVRSFEGKPLCMEQSVVPSELFPGLMERAPLKNALYVMFQQAYSCIIISAEEHLHASLADGEMAEFMGIAEGTPVLVSERVTRDLLERTVEMRKGIFVTEDLTYFVEMN